MVLRLNALPPHLKHHSLCRPETFTPSKRAALLSIFRLYVCDDHVRGDMEKIRTIKNIKINNKNNIKNNINNKYKKYVQYERAGSNVVFGDKQK